jgi:hypothetical protein
MDRLKSAGKILFVLLIAGLATVTFTNSALADCGIVWTLECTSEVIMHGQETYRISGTYITHNYHEVWGEASYTIPMGYWNPQEGDQGVRWTCPNNSTQDIGFGWKIEYRNGAWRDVIETTAIPDKYGRLPDHPLWIPTYIEQPVMHGVSLTACSYLRPDQESYSVRWRDTRDEMQTVAFQDIIIVPWEQIIVVANYYQLAVPLPYPAAEVVRSPWPRAIAGQPVSFAAAAYPVYASSEVIDACTPDILNFQLHLRLTPIFEAAPEWNFADRDWSREPGTALGWEVTHVFNTASYNLLPAFGPSLDGSTRLPAYPVTLKLAWLVEANRTWNDFRGNAHETGWQVVDLTEYGYNTPYLITSGARDVTPPPPGVPAQDLPDYFVPVPVIESQAILSAP